MTFNQVTLYHLTKVLGRHLFYPGFDRSIFGYGAKATQSGLPKIQTWVAMLLLQGVAFLVPSRLVAHMVPGGQRN